MLANAPCNQASPKAMRTAPCFAACSINTTDFSAVAVLFMNTGAACTAAARYLVRDLPLLPPFYFKTAAARSRMARLMRVSGTDG